MSSKLKESFVSFLDELIEKIDNTNLNLDEARRLASKFSEEAKKNDNNN